MEQKMSKYKVLASEVSSEDVVLIPEDAMVAGVFLSGDIWRVVCLVPMPEEEGEEPGSGDIPPES